MAAVQALYLVHFSQQPLSVIIPHFLDKTLGSCGIEETDGKEEWITLPDMNANLFTGILRSYQENKSTINNAIEAVSVKEDSAKQLDILLQAILSAAMAELLSDSTLDTPVIISEYTDITACFYGQSFTSLINALLDKFAKTVRAG